MNSMIWFYSEGIMIVKENDPDQEENLIKT